MSGGCQLFTRPRVSLLHVFHKTLCDLRIYQHFALFCSLIPHILGIRGPKNIFQSHQFLPYPSPFFGKKQRLRKGSFAARIDPSYKDSSPVRSNLAGKYSSPVRSNPPSKDPSPKRNDAPGRDASSCAYGFYGLGNVHSLHGSRGIRGPAWLTWHTRACAAPATEKGVS